jgi:DNA-binding NtrC family response regulator
MMSGHATIDTAVEATRIGALNFLEKPIALQKLLKAVEQGLMRGKQLRTLPHHLLTTHQPNLKSTPTDSNLTLHESTAPSSFVQGESTTISFDTPLRDARDAFERAYFEYHLAREHGSMTRVAERTGLERTHLYRKLKQLGVELHRHKGEIR